MTLETSGNTDWNCFVGGGGFQAGTPPAGCAVTTGATQVTADSNPKSPGEIGWINGQKFDTMCPGIEVKNTPAKDDFTNVAAFSDTQSSSPFDTFFYGATIRSTANGNSSGDVEFNQATGNQTTSSGCRTDGDRLLAYDFLNGGTSLDFHLITWITSLTDTLGGNNTGAFSGCLVKNDSPPCWGASVIKVSATLFDGQANQSPIIAANNGISGADLVAQQFAEFGINLSKALGLEGKCLSFPQQVWESRSSASSFTSNPEDLEFSNETVSTCGEIKIIKQSDPRGQDKVFPFTSNLPQLSTAGGVPCTTGAPGGVQANGNFCLNDNGNTGVIGSTNSSDNSTANTVDEKLVPLGSYTVSESTPPGGFTFESLTCSKSGTGTSVSPTSSTSVKTATITLGANGVVTCVFVNQQNTASLGTAVSNAGPVLPGVTPVHDTATVTGNQTADTPSGTVTFYMCSFATSSTSLCDGTTNVGTSIGTGTLSGSGATANANSPNVNCAANGTGCAAGQNPLTAGRYCFRAVWGGDTNYPGTLTEYGATGDVECFTVAKANSSTVTTPNDGSGVTGAETTITLGSTIYDTAVVTGISGGGSPGGTVTFSTCGPIATGSCNGADAAHTGTQLGTPVTLTATGDNLTSSATSTGFTPPDVGRYCFSGVYNGSTVYNGSSDQRSSECFTVTDTTGIISGQTWLPNDSATVTGTNGATLNGTLTAQLYTGNNCGVTSGASVGLSQKYSTPVSGVKSATVTTTNSTYTVTASGSVSWLITFSSTDPNVSGQTHCESGTLTLAN